MPRLSTLVPPDIPDCFCPFFLPSCLGRLCPHHLKVQVVTLNNATTSSCPASLRAPAGTPHHHQLPLVAGCQQGPLRAGPTALGFSTATPGLPLRALRDSVTHGAAMLGGAVTGLGTIPWCPLWFNMALPGMAWLSMDWHSWPSAA